MEAPILYNVESAAVGYAREAPGDRIVVYGATASVQQTAPDRKTPGLEIEERHFSQT